MVGRSEYVQSPDRGPAVIRCFDAATPRLAIANIARETGLTRATAPRRFLHTLDKPRLRGLGVRPLPLAAAGAAA